MLPITPEQAKLALLAIDLGHAFAKQLRLSNLDDLTPEMRKEIEEKAATADERLDSLAPKTED